MKKEKELIKQFKIELLNLSKLYKHFEKRDVEGDYLEEEYNKKISRVLDILDKIDLDEYLIKNITKNKKIVNAFIILIPEIYKKADREIKKYIIGFIKSILKSNNNYDWKIEIYSIIDDNLLKDIDFLKEIFELEKGKEYGYWPHGDKIFKLLYKKEKNKDEFFINFCKNIDNFDEWIRNGVMVVTILMNIERRIKKDNLINDKILIVLEKIYNNICNISKYMAIEGEKYDGKKIRNRKKEIIKFLNGFVLILLVKINEKKYLKIIKEKFINNELDDFDVSRFLAGDIYKIKLPYSGIEIENLKKEIKKEFSLWWKIKNVFKRKKC